MKNKPSKHNFSKNNKQYKNIYKSTTSMSVHKHNSPQLISQNDKNKCKQSKGLKYV